MALAMAVAAIKADPQAREGVDTAPLPIHPMPAQTDLAGVPIQLAAHEMRTWLDEVATEADLVADMVTKHAERLAGFYAARAKPTATRDEEYREAFRPFHDVAELRREIERHSLGKTGRLMTMDELAALSDSQLEPLSTHDTPHLCRRDPLCAQVGGRGTAPEGPRAGSPGNVPGRYIQGG